ncbi:hypothetical protein V6N11_018417 [Hibiscus sabdariffa]|uniref:Uncharacterized protein n=1 Tax=Hibiscus sabdariffa TaxID=183260 RepID=A0ABR2T854_9ROSI
MTKDIPHDHMVHTNTSDVVEEAVEEASLDPENSETAADRLASEDVPYDPMVHNDTSDMMEEALEISSGCVLLADLAGVIQANGTGADVPSGPAPFVAATPLRSIPVPASVASLMGVATATSLNAEEGVVISTEANVGVDGSHDVSAVDVSGKVHITDNILFGDERDVFVTRVAHEAAAPVVVAPAFDAIEEWLAEDNDSDVQITADLPVKIPAKRSSGGSDPSKAKRARSITTSSIPKDSRVLKAGMSSSKISSAAVDKQPRQGK